MQYKMQKKFFDVLTRLELYLRRQEIDLPNWLTKTKSKGRTKDRTWTKTFLQISWRKTLLRISWTKIFSRFSWTETFFGISWTKTFLRNSCRKSKPQTIKQVIIRTPHSKLSALDLIETDNLFNNCHTFKFLLLPWFTIDIIISNTIDLLKQTWFPLERKDSQIEGFSAN